MIELSIRVGLGTAVPLALSLLTGCTGDEPAPATPSTAAPAGSAAVPAASGELPEAEAPRGNLAGVGDGGDWDAIILDCTDPAQEAVVQHVTNADVTGDGVADALVTRTCDVPASYVPSTVEVFDGASPAQRPWRVGTPLLSAAGQAAERPWVTGTEVRSGTVVIRANATMGTGRADCPKSEVTYRYQLRGTEFQLIGRSVTTRDRCLPAG